MYAIISDIHGNYDALMEVFKDISKYDVTDIVCLGDIVGYGPEPEKCIDEIKKRCRFVLCGNHDFALIYGPYGFSFLAKGAIECTRKRMLPHCYELKEDKQERWKFIKELKGTVEEGNTLYVHASPREPIFEYIFGDKSKMFSKEVLQENFKLIKKYCFVGHTHHPVIILDNFECIYPEDVYYEYEIPKENKAIINVGSVGQPRDGDNRSCYALVDEAKIIYRRVSYDFEAVIKKLDLVECIDKRCGMRLRLGK